MPNILRIISNILFLWSILGFSSPDVHAQSNPHDKVSNKNSHNTDDEDPFVRFLQACAEGEIEVVEILLEEYPSFAQQQSVKEGEGCLHVAGIRGQSTITKALLRAGADPDQRSAFELGLRMTPLSWNVYGGHVATARALLEGGAKVNLDFDNMLNPNEKVTVLDLLYDVILDVDNNDEDPKNQDRNDPNDPHYGRYHSMKNLLLEYGAKRYSELSDVEEL